MRKSILILVTIVALLGSVAGCRKAPVNGDLDGQWQVMKIDYKDSIDVVPEQVYYCFFLHTVNLSRVGGGIVGGNMQYDEGGKTLRLQFPYNDGKSLNIWGMDASETVFSIKELTGKCLVIESNIALIELRKF